ncbi:hypothetical protein IX51_06535 [uncultured archaeon]|nr:hypothetical protein IX51_06535 [uncultured archaeon]
MTEPEGEEKKTNSFEEIKRESIEKLATLITSAFGLVAALAWNSAILKIFSVIFGSSSDLLAMVLYAVIVTVIAVVITIYIGRVAGKMKKG